MKVISYSLFGDPSSFEFNFYLRGVYLNARMNRILYPDFITYITYDSSLPYKVTSFIAGLVNTFDKTVAFTSPSAPRCEAMLWRMKPLWEDFELVICRDLDSVSTYREANCVYDWLKSYLPFHAINDNAAHGGLMGGLVSFKAKEFIEMTGYKSFKQMIGGLDLRHHGSDQNFLNNSVLPKIKNKLFFHNLKGAGGQAGRTETTVPDGNINKKLWVSDLISRYIGSAGVIDFELIRFFQSFDKNQKFDEFERKYSDIMYWRGR